MLEYFQRLKTIRYFVTRLTQSCLNLFLIYEFVMFDVLISNKLRFNTTVTT